MKTIRFIKSSAAVIIIVSMLFIAIASQASGLPVNAYKKNHIEEFHKILEEKAYTNISQFIVTKGDVHQSKYVVNFINDGRVYDTYFNEDGEITEVYEVANFKNTL